MTLQVYGDWSESNPSLAPVVPPRHSRVARSAPDAPPSPAAATVGSLVGLCVEQAPEGTRARSLIAYRTGAQSTECRWCDPLEGIQVRRGDRVLLAVARNWPQPLIVGVLEHPLTEPTAPQAPAVSGLQLSAGQSLAIADPTGKPLLEIAQGAEGAVLRIASDDLALELPGQLRIRAGSIELATSEGALDLRAAGDVVVEGQVIRLN